MVVNITGRKIHLKDSFKERVEKKLSKFDRIFGEDAVANVTVTLEKNHETVEVTISKPGMIYRAEKSAEDKDDALDEVIYVLGRKIRKNKSRLEKRIHSGAIEDVINVDESENIEKEYQVVKTKIFAVKPMSVEEAILQMNMIGHQFFMFRDPDTNEINVVYRRKDNDYGLLQPDIM